MNWHLKLVLLFAKLQKPIDPEDGVDIHGLRKKSAWAAKLGTRIFDRPVKIWNVSNTKANYIPVRIYQNSNKPNQRVIIYYHGGGFVLYGLDSHDNVCRRLSQMNECVVVSVDYSLAPEFTYPKAHDDAYSALTWVKENISKYCGNADDLIVAGDSAGGNLSACMALRCRDNGIKLKAQILIYPWIDGKLDNPSIDRNGDGYLLTKPTMFWFQQQYTPKVEDRLRPELCPCYQTNLTGLAPALIITAELDPLLDDGKKYFEQLVAAGNKAQYAEYPGLVHGFFNIPLVDPQAVKCYWDIKAFLANV